MCSDASRRDYRSRAAFIADDPIGKISIARLSVADVERWHARMRKTAVGETAIRSRHAVLRAALAQAVRWDWVSTNVASNARLRQRRQTQRESMSVEEVRAVITAAATIDRAAALALRLAAAAGLRRAELAALRWDDVDGDRLRVDSSVARHEGLDGESELVDAPTKTANRRVVRLDSETIAEISAVRAQHAGVSGYMFSLDDEPAPPARIGWRWTRARASPASIPSGACTTFGTGRPRWRSVAADVRTVAGRLGHANAAMTLRTYAHAVESADQEVASMLGGLLDG